MKHGDIYTEDLIEFIEGIGVINEYWLPIQGSYTHEISNFGRVRSLKRHGKLYTRLMKPQLRSGYLSVVIKINGSYKNCPIHSLVAKHFIPNPENKPQVNHIGLDKSGIVTKLDNRFFSLEWATASENMAHAYKNNLVGKLIGEKHHLTYLTNEQVLNIINSSETDSILSVKYGMPRRCINNIRIGRSWSHLTGIVYKKKKIKRPSHKEILDIFNSPLEYMDISKKFGFSRSTVCNIKLGKIHSEITGLTYQRKYKK